MKIPKHVSEITSELTLREGGYMRTFITNKKEKIRSVGLIFALIVILIAVAFIPLWGRLYAQSMLEDANPSKASPAVSPTTEERQIIIVVSKGGEIFIGKKRYTISGLKGEILNLMASYSGDIDDLDIFVRADANTPYMTLFNVISGIRETGVKRVWLITSPVVASKPRQPVGRSFARKGETKATQIKETEPQNEESLKAKEETTVMIKPAEPSATTTAKEIEEGQEPAQEQASDSTKEKVESQSERMEVPEEVKKEEKVIASVNYLDGIKITGWSLYTAWGFPIIHHVTIENANDTAYKNIRIRASYYYSYSTTSEITDIGRATGILPVTLSPHSRETYLEDGATLERSSACSMYIASGGIEVLGATPVEEANIQSSRKDEFLLEFTDKGLFIIR